MSDRQTDTNFSGRYDLFPEQIPFFQEPIFMCSLNRYRFSRSTFLATEQIQIIQELLFNYRVDTDFQGAIFLGYRTDTDLPGAPFLATEQITIF